MFGILAYMNVTILFLQDLCKSTIKVDLLQISLWIHVFTESSAPAGVCKRTWPEVFGTQAYLRSTSLGSSESRGYN